MRSFGRFLLIWLAALAPLCAEESGSVSIAKDGPVELPKVPGKCVLVCYPLPPDFLGEVTAESLRQFLANNGIAFKEGGFAVYSRIPRVLLVAAAPEEHQLFTTGLHGD